VFFVSGNGDRPIIFLQKNTPRRACKQGKHRASECECGIQAHELRPDLLEAGLGVRVRQQLLGRARLHGRERGVAFAELLAGQVEFNGRVILDGG